MKKLLLVAFVATVLSSCGPHLYSTRSAGQDNVSYVIVLTGGGDYQNVVVEVDGQMYPVEKVYKIKMARKAHPIIITPGKHSLKVWSADRKLLQENIFLGLQETKKITLP